MQEVRLPGGNVGGAVRVGDTVRRATGPWTPAVHALLRHLESVGLDGAPRVVGTDERGREVLSYLDGETVGDRRPWPAWVHADAALVQAAAWLRRCHAAVADFVPPAEATWRMGGTWRPGLVVVHHDAAPYNAVWRDGRLVGFCDWDFAGPSTTDDDLAFTAFSWVPLHARHVVTAEGFTDFADRPRRLALFLDAYGWPGTPADLLPVVARRVRASADGIRLLAARGEPPFVELLRRGAADDLDLALAELPAVLG